MKKFSVDFGIDQVEPAGGGIHRAIYSLERLVDTPDPSIRTLYDVFQYSVKKYGNKHGFAFRRVENTHVEEKQERTFVDGIEQQSTRTLKSLQLSSYNYITYQSAFRLVHDIGNGFVHLGLGSAAKVALFAPTSVHWMMTAHGLFTQNMTIVTAYDTLGEEELVHLINETAVEAIYTSGELLPLVGRILERCLTIKFVVYHGETTAGVFASAQKGSVKCIISFDDLARLGRKNPYNPRRPKPGDLCCIAYTSGSTGYPKGVMLKHSNIVAALGAINVLYGKDITDRDSMLAYLPLAHILEFVLENMCIFWGVTLGYGSMSTLTSASLHNSQGDLKEFQPTMMTGLPSVWESIRKAILANVSSLPFPSQVIFHRVFAAKAWLLERHLPTNVIDKAMFNDIREQVGGRLRLAFSGGGPLSVETQRFFSVTLCPIMSSYGLTESCGMCATMVPETLGYGHVGVVTPCCEIKLVDVPEANYLSTNQPRPQGEVWVRGPSICEGYWKRDDLTQDVLSADGWFRTGDVGEWNENGTLTIINRKSSIVKLSNGEFIALEKLESIYRGCIYISNICVYADAFSSRPVAIVVPNQERVQKLAKQLGVAKQDWEDMCNDQRLKMGIFEAILHVGKHAKLKPAETLSDVRLTSQEWTQESGLITASQKIKRQDINKRFRTQLNAMTMSQQL